MRNNYQNKRRMPVLKMALLAIGTLIFGGAGTLGTLWYFGQIDLSFLFGQKIPADWISVPVTVKKIPAYSKVTREYLCRPGSLSVKYMPQPPDRVKPDTLLDVSQIFGRVVRREIGANMRLTEADFLPEGTRPGVVAGIPAGKRALTLEVAKLAGAFGLASGDHVDLVATVPIDSKNNNRTSGISGSLAAQQQMASIQKRASVRVLAQDAVVVTPVTSRNKPVESNSLTSGKQVKNVPVFEIVIAVAPVEVAPISEALATHVEVTCVARSGLPDDPGAVSKTPGSDPIADMKIVDSISGKKREALIFSAEGYRVPADQPESTDTAVLEKPAIGGTAPAARSK